MDKVFTEQPILDAGIRSVNFFNGRLLTAEDLTAEQTANVQARRLLAQALGDGVAEGFFVSMSGKPEDYSLSVEAGLAVNRRGDVLQLASPTAVSMTGSLKSPGEQVATIFSDCTNLPSGQFTPTGLYLLTISPASGGEGRAPTSGLGNTTATCNTRFIVQGVVFHLIRLSTPAITNQLRNILAYQSFGFLPLTGSQVSSASPVAVALEAPLSTPPAGYGLLDSLSLDKFPICHVPLALIYTTPSGINFVDNWSVRRRITSPTATQPWQVFRSPRRTSEMEAIFLQFQEHLADLVEDKVITSSFHAASRFKLLPPVGILPGVASGCDWRAFLSVHAPAYESRLDSGLLTSVVAEAMTSSPFVVEDPDRPPVAVDVFTIPVNKIPLVKVVDEAMAAQLEMVGRNSLMDILDITDPNASYVLFARSLRGRIRLSFTSHAFDDSKAFFDADATESNLQVRANPTPSGDYVFPNLDQGYYLVKGSIQGFKPIPTALAEVIAGEVTRLQVKPEPLTLRLCLTSELIDKFEFMNVRMCLVEGTFEAAIAMSESQPWANFIEVELNDAAADQQLLEWQEAFHDRFPDLGIDKAKPQVYLSDQIGGKMRLGAPESAMAYVVFEKIGFPLTFIKDTNIKRNPIPLDTNLSKVSVRTMKLDALTTIGITPELIKQLNKYGVIFFEQLAGGWIDMVTEAIGSTPTQSALLIQAAAKYLAQIDEAGGLKLVP